MVRYSIHKYLYVYTISTTSCCWTWHLYITEGTIFFMLACLWQQAVDHPILSPYCLAWSVSYMVVLVSCSHRLITITWSISLLTLFIADQMTATEVYILILYIQRPHRSCHRAEKHGGPITRWKRV
ncbi:hypothetical protein BO94DRAFT_311438 [Aspergillus sclerotioniger CBS 115572]|uniref:Uncharacterized protein n=1 Tax=Aspergillus sclerotioniger CBS 115572 TaxID=1450535 RepID=A0A317X5L4_9EURO|nr:hypothetical protein BO94DRAFT_311438 [Aspergillus sclerotioniger CBS 115572]PWY93863.1 hypothetical protein BO94DRAFT_311438 [Aspergillus sclerotioniger CBS 115572]